MSHRSPTVESGLFPEAFWRAFFEQPAYGLREIRLVVTSTMPRGVVTVAQDTEIELLPPYMEIEEPQRADVTYDDSGGLQEVKRSLREGLELPLKRPEAVRRLGIWPTKGFLLFGPLRTGKTPRGNRRRRTRPRC